EVVLTETPQAVLEVAALSVEGRVRFDVCHDPFGCRCAGRPKLDAPDGGGTVLLLVLTEDRFVVGRDQGDEAFCSPKDAAEGVLRAIGVSLLEGPDQPRVERVVPRTVGDVRDTRKQLAVERNARRLD